MFDHTEKVGSSPTFFTFVYFFHIFHNENNSNHQLNWLIITCLIKFALLVQSLFVVNICLNYNYNYEGR